MYYTVFHTLVFKADHIPFIACLLIFDCHTYKSREASKNLKGRTINLPTLREASEQVSRTTPDPTPPLPCALYSDTSSHHCTKKWAHNARYPMWELTPQTHDTWLALKIEPTVRDVCFYCSLNCLITGALSLLISGHRDRRCFLSGLVLMVLLPATQLQPC